MERLQREPGAAQRELRDYDAEFYVERPAPLALGQVQALPVPGRRSSSATRSSSCTPPRATRPTAWRSSPAHAACSCVGDYLSDVEIPWDPGGSLSDYRATLARLAPLVEAAEVVVPGHGSPHDRDTALRMLDEDVAYLDALERGDERLTLPEGRDRRRSARSTRRTSRAFRPGGAGQRGELVLRKTLIAVGPGCSPAARPRRAAPELSTSDRLDDRRYVATGTRAYVGGHRGRPLPGDGLPHARRDGRHLDAAAEAARRALVRARRPGDRAGARASAAATAT